MDAASCRTGSVAALGAAARRIGARRTPTGRAARPTRSRRPTASCVCPAAFTVPDGKFAKPNGYGAALWYGVFDAAYTRPGDYLVQDSGTWFVAAQQPLLPVLCVQTNRIVSFVRAGSAREATASTPMAGSR